MDCQLIVAEGYTYCVKLRDASSFYGKSCLQRHSGMTLLDTSPELVSSPLFIVRSAYSVSILV